MIDAILDSQPLAKFHENSAEFIEHMKATHKPMTLTVDGHAEVVVQEAAAYQRLLDLATLADPEEGLRQGLEDIAENRTQPAREVFANFREKHGIRG